ncbi:MAG: hypothetical protein HZB40_04565 [Rhodocyclales bacterium]|nr:hypothetical protein [Rhodocyclales bacterium]
MATVVMALLPDLVHMLPVLAWVLGGDGAVAELWRYAIALPGQEPGMPPWVGAAAHHLHCILHSGVLALIVTAALWRWRASLGLPLAGWWSHILIDVLTHSSDYYASPVLYPLTYEGFDGMAWNTPWFMAANYLALAICAYALWRRP